MTEDPGSRALVWSRPIESLAAELQSGPGGLSSAEAAAQLQRDGPNRISERQSRGRLGLLAQQLASPMILILGSATVLSMVLGDVTDGAIILAIIAASSGLGAWQEHSAGQAVAALLRRVQVHVEVLRDGVETSVAIDDVVRGDVVILRAGDIVPADCAVLTSKDLLLDEAALTGESYPVEKQPGASPAGATAAERRNAVFRGTHVVSGMGNVLVLRTGRDTEFGQVAHQLLGRRVETGFEKGITRFGLLLLRAMAVLVTVVFGLNLLLGRPYVDSLLFSLALAVGLTPQMLPAIVAVSLATGARFMARKQVIVKRLDAIEDFGSMDTLCVDKTGTITAGAIELSASLDLDAKPSDVVLALARLNSGLQEGFENPLDRAILGNSPAPDRALRLGEVPYDFARKRLSVLTRVNGETLLITKGAFDKVINVCATAALSTGEVSLDAVREDLAGQFERLSSAGNRVLALATRTMPERSTCSVSDEAGMTLRGLLAFYDPPKEGAAQSIARLGELGIAVRLVTGDNHLAAREVARAVGIPAELVLTGAEVAALKADELSRRAGECHVFAEVEPLHKERIVRALRDAGHVVGFLGDGINDAAALHAADVGISVDTAVDVAKQAAAIVLLDKSLDVIADGVALGRQTFANTLKYVRVTVSANFGNMLSLAAATAFLPFLPLLPRQILLLNFLSDIPAVTIASDSVDPEQVARPFQWEIGAIRTFMVLFGALSSVFDLTTFAVLRFGFHSGATGFRSAWFIESTLTELAALLLLRTHRPFFRSRPGRTLLASSTVVGLVSVALPFSPLSGPLGLSAVRLSVLGSLAGITACYVLANELAKGRILRARAAGAA